MAHNFDDTSFDPYDFDIDPENDESGGEDDINDLDQLWEFAYDDYDLVEYEFHGTGDTGG